MHKDGETVFPVWIEAPISVTYDLETKALRVDYTVLHPGREGGLPMTLRFDAETTRTLADALRQIEAHQGGPIGEPPRRHSAQ